MRRLVAAAALCAMLAAPGVGRAAPGTTYAQAADAATATLLHVYYAGGGLWRACDAPSCPRLNSDWGVDSLTYALFLRWQATHDPALAGTLAALERTAPAYPAPCLAMPCSGWSDVPQWDAIAAVREYEAMRDPAALAKAEAAFRYVAGARVYAVGACPQVDYQQPGGGNNRLKTLETDANAIKAALLLARATGDRGYLAAAVRRYAAVRRFFYDPAAGLYSVYVFDDGTRCSRLPHRFFASVNGDMIWSGVELAARTGDAAYRRQALATARAAATRLADPAGVFADLQAENDVVEPLVEAMYVLAVDEHAAFARRWILVNAAAALSARAADGAFGRFFDGPPPRTLATAWQTNGGLAVEIAAGALDPAGRVAAASPWRAAAETRRRLARLPASVTFRGSAIAFLGTLGERCCEPGRARVLVDGRETFDETGVWQGKSSLGRPIPDTVLFAWRWPRPGVHTIRFAAGRPNAKEGGPFLDVRAYLVAR